MLNLSPVPMEKHLPTLLSSRAGMWLLAASVTAIAAVGGFAYNYGKDVGDSACANLRVAQELGLDHLAKLATDASAKLKTTSEEFLQLLQTNASYQELLRERDTLAKELESTLATHNSTKAELAETRSKLDAVLKPGKPLRIDLNKSISIGPDLNVGLAGVGSSAQLYMNGHLQIAYPGSNLNLRLKDKTCNFQLVELASDHVMISLFCDWSAK